MIEIFRTKRLVVRKIEIEDAPFLYKLLNSPEWIANIGDRNLKSVHQVENYIRNVHFIHYQKHSYGAYLVCLLDGTRLGTTGLYNRDTLDIPDVGFAFLNQHTRKGYAYESTYALLDYAVTSLSFEKVAGITIPDNLASIRLLEKLGLTHIKSFVPQDEKVELMYFEKKLVP